MDSSDPTVIFLETIILIYAVIAGACSSPQTTDVNASKRAETLMKWVHIAFAQCALFVGIEIVMLHKLGRPVWPAILGAGVASPIMYGSYVYAKHSGTKNPLPGTES
jgi:hypothetical protein